MVERYADSILKNCEAVDNICAPIFSSLKTKAFSFCRAYEGGGRVYFCNFSDWGEHVIKRDYLNTFSHKKEDCFQRVSLWKFWPEQDKKYRELIQDAEQSFSQNSGIVITRRYKTYSDFFSLRGYSAGSVDEVNNSYLNNLELISRFTDYFLNESSRMIQDAERGQLVFAKEQIQDGSSIGALQDNGDFDGQYKELLDVFSVNNAVIFCEGMLLTPRQVECVVYMMLGKSSKEIAKTLMISQRTVEAHISHLKSKLNVNFKSAIIEKVLSLPQNRRIILDKLNQSIYN
ncbi:MAG: helix-turn-helix transcriptional regulator [Alphaproteobacteria bacterium]|nr:helix-turn-helix transcriptional regulator [Alphaproteobacteria bacterium]